MQVIFVVLYFCMCVALFFLVREIVCWYHKTNAILFQLRELQRQLHKHGRTLRQISHEHGRTLRKDSSSADEEIPEGQWKCTCGSLNPSEDSHCACGRERDGPEHA
jgi:hypothetical protein